MNGKILEELQEILQQAVSSGQECGCQLAVYEHGELVADLCAGSMAPGGAPVTPETLFTVFSVGKGVMATVIHRLVEKGVLSYSTRLGDSWPEFDCNGKESVLLWHVLTHRSGLSPDPHYQDFVEMANWDVMCQRLAKMAPQWQPGTRCQYHPHTYGWLLGEVARRADGRELQQIICDEVIRPLGLEKEMFFGTNDEIDKRVAMPDTTLVAPDSHCYKLMSVPEIRHACIPSFTGIMSARAVARHYAALEGPVDGVQLLREETLANAAITRRAANDPVNPNDLWPRFGLGYVTYGFEDDLTGLIGHGGALGAEGFLDRRQHIAVGFTKNRINPTHPVHPVRDAIAKVLGCPIRHW